MVYAVLKFTQQTSYA